MLKWDGMSRGLNKANAPPAIKLAILSGEKAKLAAFKTLTTPEFLHLLFSIQVYMGRGNRCSEMEKTGSNGIKHLPG